MNSGIEEKIEQALMSKFPGLKLKFSINKDGSWNFQMLQGSKERFDEQYPNMSKAEADAQILDDIKSIINDFIPDAKFIGFERYGKYSYF